jgi:dienelactone hydrolase
MKYFLLLLGLVFTISSLKAQSGLDIFSYSKTKLEVQIVKKGKLDSLKSFEKVVLEGLGSKIPFYHFINKKNKDKKYAILLHGLGGNKMFWIYPSKPYLQYTENLTSIKDQLLDLGFNIVIIDAKFHGERSYEIDFRDPSYLTPERSGDIGDAGLFYEMMVETVKEVRLVMDYIEKNQDKSIEFNVVGYSMGGNLAILLNAVDERVKSIVACVPPLERPQSEVESLNWNDDIVKKMKAISPVNYIVDQKAPVALLIGQKDFFTPPEVANSFYKDLPMNDKKLKVYQAGHELPVEYVDEVISWLVEHNKE